MRRTTRNARRRRRGEPVRCVEVARNMDTQMMQTVAKQVARRWKRKGVTSYSVEDMEQDAMAAMLEAHGRFDAELGVPLRAYLWSVAVNATNLTVAKALCPVSASRASYLKSVQLEKVDDDTFVDAEEDQEQRDTCKRVRARLQELTFRKEDEYGVSILLGHAPADVAKTAGVPIQIVYESKRRILRRCKTDRKLLRLAKEAL